MTRELHWNGFVISVTPKQIRNMYLRMGALCGHLQVSVPRGTRDDVIFSFVSSKIKWIEKHLKQQKKRELEKNSRFENPNDVFVWGKRFSVHLTETEGVKNVSVSDTSIVFSIAPDSGKKEKRELLLPWLTGILAEEIRSFTEKWSAMMGCRPKRIVIRQMKTRWGACTPALESIRINFALVHLEKIFLDYVVLHELVHLLEPSHNARFASLMDQWMPDWREIRKRLKNANPQDSVMNFANIYP